MSMNNLEQKRREQLERNREGILYCEEEANRGVLLSNPPQYQCKRDGCYQTWVVGSNPPICKMFDYKKHLDTRTTDSFNAGALAVIEDIRRKMPSYWVDNKNRLRTIDQDDMTAYVEDHLTTLEAKLKDYERKL